MAGLPSLVKVVPAQLSFLALYNPTYGQTDESADEQIFYFFSRSELDDASQNGKSGRASASGDFVAGRTSEDAQNAKLRQVGLARGMVEFANNFSNGVPVESVETEKSRMVLRELEPNWWILASVNLTRLPAAMKDRQNDGKDGTELGRAVEYSAREVAPPQLLLAQLQQAHAMFLLHHAVTMHELLQRVGRSLFTDKLHRFWSRFVMDWDVLLHGNPAVDVYNCARLAAGGELGIGVGEEEWGSGEREVLEDFVSRTEGLVDLVVARYGDAPSESLAKKKNSEETGRQQWLGLGDEPRASDGLIFSGTGALSRRSLATLSQWMDAIFRDGEHAFGVGENPSSRTRRRRQKRKMHLESGGVKIHDGKPAQEADSRTRLRSPQTVHPSIRRTAIENAANSPGIPPPLLGPLERPQREAANNVQGRDSVETGPQNTSQDDTVTAQSHDESFFDTDKMMALLKLGYGSSWTLSPKGFHKDIATDKATTQRASTDAQPGEKAMDAGSRDHDPASEVSDDEAEKEKTFTQHLDQSIGRFLIGLAGDLENTEFDDDPPDGPDATGGSSGKPSRIFMRTIILQMSDARTQHVRHPDPTFHPYRRSQSAESSHSIDIPTSAAASIDGADSNVTYEKVRTVVYVHQPFIFSFLFDLHTPNLGMPAFYRKIHNQLGPLQKPLLRSTDPTRIPERILHHLGEKADSIDGQAGLYDLVYDPAKLTVRTSIPNIPAPGTLAAEGVMQDSSQTVSGAWYTLGIPMGSSTAAGTSSLNATDRATILRTDWTRLEALNIHSHILNIWASNHATRSSHLNPSGDLEQTVKTARGWWLVWMRILSSPSSAEDARPSSSATTKYWKNQTTATDQVKEAFLVRKALDASARAKEANGKSASSGRWLLRDQTRDISGSTAGSQTGQATSAQGVIEGVGVDARRWVEGLIRLSQ